MGRLVLFSHLFLSPNLNLDVLHLYLQLLNPCITTIDSNSLLFMGIFFILLIVSLSLLLFLFVEHGVSILGFGKVDAFKMKTNRNHVDKEKADY